MPNSNLADIGPVDFSDGDPCRVVFVCYGNACRSQMAEGFAHHFGLDWLEVSGAGISPLGFIPQPIIDVMAEKDIDVVQQSSTGLDAVDWDNVSLLVDIVGMPDGLVPYTGAKVSWEIDDPFQEPMEEYRRVRDVISEMVAGLIETLKRQRG